jgi:hypothetical protein
MESINVELLKSELTKLETKLGELAKINGFNPKNFDGLEFEDDCVRYKTSDYWCGEWNSDFFSVTWEELNEPMEYFIAKIQAQVDAEKKRKEEVAQREAKAKEQRERIQLEQLLKKYKS